MAYLLQSGSGISDTDAFSYSGWFWLPPSPLPNFDQINLLQWGDPTDFWQSGLYFSTLSGRVERLVLDCIGPPGSLLARITTDINGGPFIAGANIDRFLCGFRVTIPTGHVVNLGSWNHIFASIDLSGTDLLTFTPSHTIARGRSIGLYLNGVNQLLEPGGKDALYQTTYDNRLDNTTPRACPNFSTSVSGFPLGFPTTPAYLTGQPLMRFGEIQVWFNQYIDPSIPANFAKFVTISAGKGRPANSDLSLAAFGPRTIHFKGKASDSAFFTNRGVGGAFTKVGAPIDFTPGPSY